MRAANTTNNFKLCKIYLHHFLLCLSISETRNGKGSFLISPEKVSLKIRISKFF